MPSGFIQVLWPPSLDNRVMAAYLEYKYETNKTNNTTTIQARYIVSKFARYAPYYTSTATDATTGTSIAYMTINGSNSSTKQMSINLSPKGIHDNNKSNFENITASSYTYFTDWFTKTLSHSSSGALTITVGGAWAFHKYSGSSSSYKALPNTTINASYSRIPSNPNAPSYSFPSATAAGGDYFTGNVTLSTTATGSYTRFVVNADNGANFAESGWFASTPGQKAQYTFNLYNYPLGRNLSGSVRCANTSDGWSTTTDYFGSSSTYRRNYPPNASLPTSSNSYTYSNIIFVPTNCSISSDIGDSGGWDIGYPQARLERTGSSGSYDSSKFTSYQSGTGNKTFNIDISDIERGSSFKTKIYVTDGYADSNSNEVEFTRAYTQTISSISSAYGSGDWIPSGLSSIILSWNVDNQMNNLGYVNIYYKSSMDGVNFSEWKFLQKVDSVYSSGSIQMPSLQQGTYLYFTVVPYNKFGEEGQGQIYPINADTELSNCMRVNYVPTTPVLTSPSNGEYFESSFTSTWEASTDQGGGESLLYVVERYQDGSYITEYLGSSTSATISLPDVQRGSSINYRLYATDGLNNSSYVNFNIKKNELPLINQSDSSITLYNVSLDNNSEYVFTEAVDYITDQVGLSFLPGSSVSTPQDELRYRPYFIVTRNGSETLIIDGSTTIIRSDTPSIISLSSFGIVPTDTVVIMLSVVDKFGIQSNEESEDPSVLYHSNSFFVNTGLSLPKNVHGTRNELDTVSKFNGVHIILDSSETYNPFFYFTVDTSGGTGIDVSVAIRRVSDNAYMTDILKTGPSASFTEMQPTTSVPSSGSQTYGVRFTSYKNGGLQKGVPYRFSIRLDREEESVLSSTSSYAFQIVDNINGIGASSLQKGQPIFLASLIENLKEYCYSWSSMITGSRDTSNIPASLKTVVRGDLISTSEPTSIMEQFTQIATGFNNVTSYISDLSTSGTLKGWKSQYKDGTSTYNYLDFISQDIVVGELITSVPIAGTTSGDNKGVLGTVLYL